MKELAITQYPQITSYSCCAAVLQSVFDYYKKYINHHVSIKLLNVDENGGYLKDMGWVCNKHLKTKHKSLNSIRQVEKYIKLGAPIIAADNVTYNVKHCVLIVGYDKHKLSVFDPCKNKVLFWNKEEFIEQTDELIVIYK